MEPQVALDWKLLEENKSRLDLLDLIEIAAVAKRSLPQVWSIYGAVTEKFKAQVWSPVYEDLNLAIILEAQLPNISTYEDLSKYLFPISLSLSRRCRIFRLARKVQPSSELEADFRVQIIDAAKEGLYPEDHLLAYFTTHPFPTGGVIWSSLDLYPKVFELALTRATPSTYEFTALISRIIERNYSAHFRIIRQWMLRTNWQHNGEYLLLRPYLLKDANFEFLMDLRRNFGLDDFGYRARNENKPMVTYPAKGFLDPDTYKGYRCAWHFLEYASKAQRTLLLQYWNDNSFDCTYAAFVDWVNWRKGTEVLIHSDTETDEKILSLMTEI